MKYKFKGYGGETPYFGEGMYLVGNIYELRGPIMTNKAGECAARIKDEQSTFWWEEIKYFEKVEE